MKKNGSSKPKILIFMHTEWRWIKQRPHFLSEELSADYDITVAYPRANRRSSLIVNKTGLRLVAIPQMPFSRFKGIERLNTAIRGFYYGALSRLLRPDVVWFTLPTIIHTNALKSRKKPFLVYDCMDDASEFRGSESEKNALVELERQFLTCIDFIFVSSQSLMEKMRKRAPTQSQISLVRNAFGGKIHSSAPGQESLSRNGPFRILYFGTIDTYLDFDKILNCLARFSAVTFDFVGPILSEVPEHPRLNFRGAVEHDKLADLMRPYDCFIMPFQTNALIQSVDPVKLYEYVNFNKNIICPYYDEIARFSDFVQFYRSQLELDDIVEKLQRDNGLKYDNAQRMDFLTQNTWHARATIVKRELDAHLERRV